MITIQITFMQPILTCNLFHKSEKIQSLSATSDKRDSWKKFPFKRTALLFPNNGICGALYNESRTNAPDCSRQFKLACI